ncbi:hypothetical protein EGY07_01585 [Chryseobacterium indologenes]|uniref:hypothetical protein n=1 Tax=Chryseobacterium indologenes TaxID=253 RepID=UPI000F507C0A|nr:hypothetical protein [Chryseobacterium indologenes]AYZ34342.1 hypothetical protein EGY07_01585 [Chryseobacterium indologenes]MBF6642881.1 hypothetical protein [Chryseobacterium indologenes]MBU3050392.1 hypothetical protein [Chryseobacterium indologenes]MEB4762436.1 hypothetical protein [Chryseobacterium indologenes]QQQ69072.1 hypothetical protein JHW31_11045 [Chryseobacterium indologenes]
MKLKIVILLFTFSIIKIFATAQAPDGIIINDKEYSLLNNPLEKYFKDHPEYHPVYGPHLAMFKRYRTEAIPLPFSTGNYCGYIATFKLENNNLVLADLEIQNINSTKRNYISVYKQLFKNKKVVLNYSGVLVIPDGKLVEFSNFSYSSLYDRYKLITIKNDTVVKEKALDKDEFVKFKLNRFEEYKKTDTYKTALKEFIRDWENDKKTELSENNTKKMSKKEIEALQKEYAQPPSEDYMDMFFLMNKKLDFVIVDY